MSRSIDGPAEQLALLGGLRLDDVEFLSSAELRPLTGYEQEWLASHPEAPSAEAVTHVLTGCLERLGDRTPDSELVGHLLVGDRDYLMLRLRRLTLGDNVAAVLTCPACHTQMDVDFHVDDVPIQRRPQATSTNAVTVGEDERQRTVQFRLPHGRDQESVADCEPEVGARLLLERCLLDNGGMPLSDDEGDVVSDAMERLAPAIDLELEVSCPECSEQTSVLFDMTRFFLDELRMQGRALLREVHYLALYYHWSLADILGLTRTRRRAFLALLADQFPPR